MSHMIYKAYSAILYWDLHEVSNFPCASKAQQVFNREVWVWLKKVLSIDIIGFEQISQIF